MNLTLRSFPLKVALQPYYTIALTTSVASATVTVSNKVVGYVSRIVTSGPQQQLGTFGAESITTVAEL